MQWCWIHILATDWLTLTTYNLSTIPLVTKTDTNPQIDPIAENSLGKTHIFLNWMATTKWYSRSAFQKTPSVVVLVLCTHVVKRTWHRMVITLKNSKTCLPIGHHIFMKIKAQKGKQTDRQTYRYWIFFFNLTSMSTSIFQQKWNYQSGTI